MSTLWKTWGAVVSRAAYGHVSCIDEPLPRHFAELLQASPVIVKALSEGGFTANISEILINKDVKKKYQKTLLPQHNTEHLNRSTYTL